METKSRYEVIAELEEKKRELIVERDSQPQLIIMKKRDIKMVQRQLEDKEEDLADFQANQVDRKETIQALIDSTDESLNRFSDMSNSQKK